MNVRNIITKLIFGNEIADLQAQVKRLEASLKLSRNEQLRLQKEIEETAEWYDSTIEALDDRVSELENVDTDDLEYRIGELESADYDELERRIDELEEFDEDDVYRRIAMVADEVVDISVDVERAEARLERKIEAECKNATPVLPIRPALPIKRQPRRITVR